MSVSLPCVDLGVERFSSLTGQGLGAQVLILPPPLSYPWSWQTRLRGKQLGLWWAWMQRSEQKTWRAALLSSPALTHTPGSAAPHNYIKCVSLKMRISPLTHFGLVAIVPASPGSEAPPMTHMRPPLPGETAPQTEVAQTLVNLGNALGRTFRPS